MGCLHGKFTADAGRISPNAASNSAPSEPVHRSGRGRALPASKDAWPEWLSAAAGDALRDLTPRRADSFRMLEKVGSGTYSNVYKARDLVTGRLVALKKVRVESSVGAALVAQEIALLRRLNHPNVVRLESLASSRILGLPSLYLVFEYMEHDLGGLAAVGGADFTEPQIKCYMKQLLSGLEHCHSKGILHRDIKSANVLVNKEGILKIADFGLATYFDPENVHLMSNQVVTLWYRPPELLLGATHYGVGVDLWSAGCILAELLTGKPLFPGRTEVDQLHKIFRLCGSPSKDYLKKLNLSHLIVTNFWTYKCCISETFADFPPSSVSLIRKLLSLDPVERGTAGDCLSSEFFTTEPYACEPSSFPQYTASKSMDAKLRGDKVKIQQRANLEGDDGVANTLLHNSSRREVQGRRNNDRLQAYRARRKMMPSAIIKSRSARFPPSHLDGAIGFAVDHSSQDGTDSFSTTELLSRTPSTAGLDSISLASVDDYYGRRDTFRRKNRGRENKH